MNKLSVIDLFAGCGGLTWGFVKQGFKIVKTVEHWPDAIATYNLNFKTNCKPLDISDPLVFNDLKQTKADLIIGGFPCQGFSMAGKRHQNDPRNQLYRYVIDLIILVQPKVAILENVKGILSYREADGTLVVDKIKTLLAKQGWTVQANLLNSVNFNVAQKRQRVIFVISQDQALVKTISNQLLNYQCPNKLNVKDAIGDLTNIKHNAINAHLITNHQADFSKKLAKLKPMQSLYPTYQDAFKRLAWDQPSPTVKENHGGVFVHPDLPRVCTPRELARLQSFPDNFIFCGSKSAILKQIGNAVPCQMANMIAKITKTALLNND